MSDTEKDGHGLDKRSRLDQNRLDKDKEGDLTDPEDLLEPPFPFATIPFPESFDT